MKTLMCVGVLAVLLAASNAGNTGGGDYEDTDYDDNADDTKHNTNIEISCKNDTDCGYPSGYCREHRDPVRYICLCENPYFSVKESEPCQEKRKSKLVAFLLSFFLGLVGADWFYLSNGRSANTLAHIFILLNLLQIKSSVH